MKINENTLAAFATSRDTPVQKEGWLWKKGELNPKFQKRWFVLKGNLLFYFESKTSKEPVGVIVLEGCVIELAEEDQERFGFKISFQGERTRVYHLGTEFQNTLIEWMRLLAVASHEYMKMMVYELEQKLLELDTVEKKRSLIVNMSNPATQNLPSNTNDVQQQAHSGVSVKKASTLPSSHSADPIGGNRLTAAETIVGGNSNSLQRLDNFNTTGGGDTGTRCNPFNQEDTSIYSTVSPNLLSEAIMDPTQWSKFHAQMGVRIVADQKRWLQEHTSKNPLVNLTNSV